MMFQSLALWPHLTLYENIVFPFAHLADSARRNRLAMEFAADLDLTGSLHTRAAQASGGERQRAAFIRVLAADPRILLLDEPTSHLDGRLTRKVMALIEQQKERGKTVVLSTHAGAFAKEVCSEMVLLRGESEPLYGDRAISDAELN
ncbi:MAG TPA: ATP-binding cassette domain-containing protein [Bradyrhizobium sp.]|nr:ATP-binding cassette domain-containing protein [Bradyrhizobium sp.]